MPADLSVTIGKVRLSTCVMNASGPRSGTYEGLAEIARSGSGAVVTTTLSREPKQAGPEPNYGEFSLGSINSRGLANPGYPAFGETIARLKGLGKPVMVSIAGSSPEEYAEAATYVVGHGADLVEINLSSTYPPDDRMVAYEPRLLEAVLAEVRKAVKVPVGPKSPIFLDPRNVQRLAARSLRNGMDFVVTATAATCSLAIDIDKEQTLLASPDGLGEIGGAVLRPMVLGNVRVLAREIGDRIPIIAAGGVETGRDAFAYILAGASAVQVGTAFAREGIGVFARIADELSSLMSQKGYGKLADFRGKLKSPA